MVYNPELIAVLFMTIQLIRLELFVAANAGYRSLLLAGCAQSSPSAEKLRLVFAG